MSGASSALARVEFLRSATGQSDVVAAVWDLRDLAYDRPQVWKGFSAELLFQALAEEVDRAPGDAVDWDGFATLLAAALAKAVAWSEARA